MNLDQKTYLERFVVDNDDLEHLESLLDQFNIFEAVGMVRQEIKHSNFLAFLLNPAASHRLGDTFLKIFLKRLLIEANNADVSPIDIDITDLTNTEVRREWKNIDLLLVSPQSQILCAIENKVGSGEHSNQLQRYRNIILEEFPDFKKIFVFLTPTGMAPNDTEDQQHWLTYSYDKVVRLIDDLCDRYRSTIGSDIYTLMQHYSSLIKTHLVGDSEIAQLCQKIYIQHKEALDLVYENSPNPASDTFETIPQLCQKIYIQHREALDLIYEHRPDLVSDVFEITKDLVLGTSSKKVIKNHIWASSKSIGFVMPNWDEMPFQKTCPKWTPATQRILIFELKVHPPNVNLYLTLGPGELSNRRAIFDALSGNRITGFVGQRPEKETGWICLLKQVVSENVTPEASLTDISQDLNNFWQRFLAVDLPRINQAIMQGLSSPPQA
jgi:hypothetical protein